MKLVLKKHDKVKDSTLILLTKGEELKVKAEIKNKIFSDIWKTN